MIIGNRPLRRASGKYHLLFRHIRLKYHTHHKPNKHLGKHDARYLRFGCSTEAVSAKSQCSTPDIFQGKLTTLNNRPLQLEFHNGRFRVRPTSSESRASAYIQLVRSLCLKTRYLSGFQISSQCLKRRSNDAWKTNSGQRNGSYTEKHSQFARRDSVFYIRSWPRPPPQLSGSWAWVETAGRIRHHSTPGLKERKMYVSGLYLKLISALYPR